MDKNKIWIVTELFYPEETAVAYIFTRIANHLSKNFKVCIICGDGEERKYILDAAKTDARIIYKGQLPRKEVLELQKKSTLLINPRSPDGEFTRYSFPPKTMEYFASGVPVLMFEIEGVPDEYYSYCYTISNNTINGLKEAIIMHCEKEPGVLSTLEKKARRFILENKNPIQQCTKIVNFINENSVTN